jgi:hypothetical protein
MVTHVLNILTVALPEHNTLTAPQRIVVSSLDLLAKGSLLNESLARRTLYRLSISSFVQLKRFQTTLLYSCAVSRGDGQSRKACSEKVLLCWFSFKLGIDRQ